MNDSVVVCLTCCVKTVRELTPAACAAPSTLEDGFATAYKKGASARCKTGIFVPLMQGY